MKERATKILLSIFAVCLKHVQTFVALQNPDLGWQIVAGDLREKHNCDLTRIEVYDLIRVFADARRRFRDQIYNHTAHAPVSTELTVPPVARKQADFSLHDSDASPVATSPRGASTPDWPPAHFTQPDTQVLNRPRIRARLSGITWRNRGAMPDLPTDKADELGLRLFLGWLGAAHTAPDSPFALRLLPVAFHANGEAPGLVRAVGRPSPRSSATLAGLLDYAAAAFGAGGKTTVLALLTPLFATPGEARALANQSHLAAGHQQ
ncbi:hypothetical protein VTK26DRAFT_7107 [Humicola hyalothermophila]